MAVTAITIGWYMVRRWCFTSCGCTVMTSYATVHDTCVIIFGTGKGRGVMTCGTIFTKWIRMLQWYRWHTSCIATIVTRCTVINDARMIENSSLKGADNVADAAVLSSRQVARVFPGSYRCARRCITVT